MELALACRYRVVVDEPGTRLGLPEVMLGIVPGWGGMLRLPQVIGAAPALDMMLTGRALDAIARFVQAIVDDVPRAVDGVGNHLPRTIHHFVVGHLFLLASPLDRLVQIASGPDLRPGIRFHDTRSPSAGQSPFPRC